MLKKLYIKLRSLFKSNKIPELPHISYSQIDIIKNSRVYKRLNYINPNGYIPYSTSVYASCQDQIQVSHTLSDNTHSQVGCFTVPLDGYYNISFNMYNMSVIRTYPYPDIYNRFSEHLVIL